MKALNHKERKHTIVQFTLSLLPFILLTFAMLFLFRQIGVKHSNFIQKKLTQQQELRKRQSEYSENLDFVLSLLDQLMGSDIRDAQYQKYHKVINDKIQESLNKIKDDELKPYEPVFIEARRAQAVIDSIYPLKQEHEINRKKLRVCIDKFNESRIKQQRKENADAR